MDADESQDSYYYDRGVHNDDDDDQDNPYFFDRGDHLKNLAASIPYGSMEGRPT